MAQTLGSTFIEARHAHTKQLVQHLDGGSQKLNALQQQNRETILATKMREFNINWETKMKTHKLDEEKYRNDLYVYMKMAWITKIFSSLGWSSDTFKDEMFHSIDCRVGIDVLEGGLRIFVFSLSFCVCCNGVGEEKNTSNL